MFFCFFFNREKYFYKIASLFISFGVGTNFFVKLFGYSILLFLWINLLPEIGIFGTSIKFRRFLLLQKNFKWNLVFKILRCIYHKTTLFSNRLLYLVNAETQYIQHWVVVQLTFILHWCQWHNVCVMIKEKPFFKVRKKKRIQSINYIN